MKQNMKQTKHTPGPWHVQDNTGEMYGQLRVDSHRGALAVCGQTNIRCDLLDEEFYANARLIAAAPEMLEALKAIAKTFGYDAADPSYTKEAELVLTAIAKATGGAK